ncbi:hypothetical protein B0H67DRAFT_647561 [Lasiosphaeris hirsuta]|uniref:Uncharacterized protein n=1 Tax=Lasiosphaeris hirsuta TaxID=260670 RepID=A0AA40A158_9PEZI|nr:hypothetical protein B0H67DRAFT_647561 [Lasiosphaeris hirsuta]
MADPLAISAAGASAAANASKAARVLLQAVQGIGDAPADVRTMLNHIQGLSSVVVRLTDQLSSPPPADVGPHWPKIWLAEVNHVVDAARGEANAVFKLIMKWDQARLTGSTPMTWPAFCQIITNDQMLRVGTRIELARSAILLLISALQLSSTPEMNGQLERTRNILSTLLAEAPIEPTPPPAPQPGFHTHTHTHVHSNPVIAANLAASTAETSGRSEPGANNDPPPSYAMSRYQNPPPMSPPQPHYDGPIIYMVRQPPGRTGQQQFTLYQPPTHQSSAQPVIASTSAAPSGAGEIASLRNELTLKDKRIQELEAELTEQRRRSSTSGAASPAPGHEGPFRDLVTKYKKVKQLYFDTKNENDRMSRELEGLRTAESASTSKDKIIEGWKKQYEELSKKLREQEDVDVAINSWREKYDLTLTLLTTSQEDSERAAANLRAENARLSAELDEANEALRTREVETAQTIQTMQDDQRKVEEEHDASTSRLAYLEQNLESHRHQLEQERQEKDSELERERYEKEMAIEVARKLRMLWQQAHQVMSESDFFGTLDGVNHNV